MKNTTFLPKLGIKSETPIPGYAATVLGVPVVVHRPLRHGRLDKGGGWVVSEPTSGMGVAQWYVRAKTKEGVLFLAEQFLRSRKMTGEEFAAHAARCATGEAQWSLCPCCTRKYRFVFATGLCYDCTQLSDATAPSSPEVADRGSAVCSNEDGVIS